MAKYKESVLWQYARSVLTIICARMYQLHVQVRTTRTLIKIYRRKKATENVSHDIDFDRVCIRSGWVVQVRCLRHLHNLDQDKDSSWETDKTQKLCDMADYSIEENAAQKGGD